MSWDVLVQNYGGNPPPGGEALDGPAPEPLGAASEIRQKIDAHLPGVVWSDARHGVFEGDGFSVEFDIGAEKPIDHVMLSVRGSGEALGALVRFAKPNRWSLFDLSEGEFIDLDDPAAAGWEGFQAYRDRVIPKVARPRKSGPKAKKPGRNRTPREKKE
ncbi:MAG TPA: hypothetical protein VIL46_14330 [Gemmataceae bacterium]